MPNADSELCRRALECPYLHGDNDFTEELEKIAKCELNEDEDTRVRCLEELRSRLKNEPGLLWQDDDQFLLAFLRARKFSVDRAFSLVKGFYGNIGKNADVFYGIDQDEARRTLLQNCMYFLPLRDSDGSSVFIFRLSAWDPKLISPELLYGTGNVCVWHVLRHNSTQIAGYKLIIDFEGLSFKHISCIRPWHLWLFGQMLQNAYPFRLRGLYMLNQNNFFHSLWVVMRQFLSKKLIERVHFHGKDVKGLHQFVDPRILPAEYEGEQPSFDNSDMRKIFEASEAYSEYFLSFGYEKSLKMFADKKKLWRKTSEDDRTQEKI